jgi:carboxypeptidase Q
MNTTARLVQVTLAFTAFLSAQTAPAPAWDSGTVQQMRQLQHAALADNYAYQQLAHLTDNIGPRPSGSLQAAAAVEYVASEMRRLGLEVTLEKVKVPQWVRGKERAELVAYPGQVPGTAQKIVVTALGAPDVGTPSGGITAEVLAVSSFAELAAMPREKVAGKIVLFNHRFDRQMEQSGFAGDAYAEAVAFRSGGRPAAAKQGAVAMLVRSAGGEGYRVVHAGGTDYFRVAHIPAAAITGEDADLIVRLLSQGPVRLHLVLDSQMLPAADSYNVIADLKGSEHPEQVVIVSGHLDSWDLGTGALDDGAGVAIAMATAHLMHELHLQPKRTIRVIAWMSEEVSVQGGLTYEKENLARIGDQFAAIETDSGAGHPMGIYTSGDDSLTDLLAPVAETLREAGAGALRRTDEAPQDIVALNVAGVPAFTPIQDVRKYFEFHHTAADTLDKVDPKELRENVAVVSVLAYALATMSGDLPRKPLPVPRWMK